MKSYKLKLQKLRLDSYLKTFFKKKTCLYKYNESTHYYKTIIIALLSITYKHKHTHHKTSSMQ